MGMSHEMLAIALTLQDVVVLALSGTTLVAVGVLGTSIEGRLHALEGRRPASAEPNRDARGRAEDATAPAAVMEALEAQARWLKKLESDLDGIYRQLSKPMARSMQQLGSIADELDSRRAEVESFRKGQEGMVAKKMLGEVVRIRCEFAEEAKDPRTPEAQRDLYDALLQLVDDHLQSSGVEQRDPRLGSEYRGNDLCEDKPRTVPCDDPALDWTIASIEEPAWVYEEGSKLTVLGKARVTVHRHRPGQGAAHHG
jgi:hypothetical protein